MACKLYTVPERSLNIHTNRLTEENITETDGDGLGLEVVVQGRLTQLTSDTGLLVTTEWQLPVKSVVGVDPHCSSTERVGNLDGGGKVGGVDSSGKAVCGGVGNLDDIGLVLEFGDCADGAEDLFLLNLHVLGDVGEDGGLDEVTLLALAVTTGLDGGTSLLALINVAVI